MTGARADQQVPRSGGLIIAGARPSRNEQCPQSARPGALRPARVTAYDMAVSRATIRHIGDSFRALFSAARHRSRPAPRPA